MRDFGELEALVMDALWTWRRPALVREVHGEVSGTHPVAYTTVLTVMETLRHKGMLDRQPVGRAYVYQATVSRAEHQAGLMRCALEQGGDTAAVLDAFLARVGDQDLQAIRRALPRSPSRARPHRRTRR